MANFEKQSFRVESDFIGTVKIPADAYYGIHSARAKDNFKISGRSISEFYDLIKALGMIKLAAVRANYKLGLIEGEIYKAISSACQDVIDLKLLHHFVVDVIQGGAGTSTNMNANEVIANRALEILGRSKGDYAVVHPNDHVNLSQSTNDVYPSAIRLALCFSLERLKNELNILISSFEQKSTDFSSIVKVGRTQLQDAVPMTLGQEFQAFAVTMRKDVRRLDETLQECLEINLGGTAIGTGINTHREYSDIVISELSTISEFPFDKATNLLEAAWDTGALLSLSSHLKRIATKISKICNDIRLMSSGPIAGYAEIKLPAVQAGSSIMPGKVNPVIPEAVNQVCFAVIGNDTTITYASEAAQFQLNAFEPIILMKLFESVRYMTNAMRMLREKCIEGIVANEKNCRRQIESGFCVATALLPIIGYDRVSKLVKKSIDEDMNFVSLIRQESMLRDIDIFSADSLEKLISPNL